jgi:hypothetical protein
MGLNLPMPTPTLDRVRKARAANVWDLGNKVLYDLCKAHPKHTNRGAVIAKIFLIGRAYAAAIERRKNKKNGEENDDFYTSTVVRKLMNSEIDSWIDEAKKVKLGTESALKTAVKVHERTTRLFYKVSKLKKRSLASKYLHFHVPKLFYIYDARAAEALHRSGKLPPASRSSGDGDNEYRKFAEKCDSLRKECYKRFSLDLSPRQIDNLLLDTNKKRRVRLRG